MSRRVSPAVICGVVAVGMNGNTRSATLAV